MHIVQVTQSYPPSQGGVENHVEAISTRLCKRGHEVTVISADRGVGKRCEVRDGVTIHRYKSVSPGGVYHLSPQVALSIKKCGPDVVHAHNYHALLLPFAAAGAHSSRLIITPHYHGGSESEFRERLLRLYHPIGKHVLNIADAVVSVSEWESKKIHDDFGIETEVIPNGINLEAFLDTTSYGHEQQYLLCVGRLEKYKGIQDVIRSISGLSDYDLLIAGSGPYRDQLKKVAKNVDVADRVHFLGYVSDNVLPSLYRGAEVFISLSSFESFGLTVGEALAAGTPCLVFRRGALLDWESYEGVTGIDTKEPEDVINGIVQAESLSPCPQSVPRWDEHVDKLEKLYLGE